MNRRRALLLFALAALLLLVAAPTAMASAGGGSGSFGGGGGGGFGGGGGGGRGFELYILFRVVLDIALLGHGLGLLFLIGLALLYWFVRDVLPRLQANWQAREQRGRTATRKTQRRTRRVELAAAEAADEDPMFDPEHVRTAASALFTQVQFAWDAGDRIHLRGLVAPELLAEWERRLDDFQSKGWRNRVELLAEPKVEYVGLARGGNQDGERVVVLVEARMRDYVTDLGGRHIKRRGEFTETVRLREFWTLQRRSDHWILQSIEQGAEGAHVLNDQIVQTPWADEQALRDEAMVEQAVADAVPAGTKIADVADLQFTGSARAAANDISLADGRFAPDVLEIAARRAVAAWADAVDGSDGPLRALADPAAIQELLHPGDPSGRSRLVVRGPKVRQIRIAGVDAATEPATMTIDVDLEGHRYLEERDTARVLAGNPARSSRFTERWTLAVTDDSARPWRIVAVRTPAAIA